MTEPIPCLRCQTPMEAGYVADHSYGAFTQEQWTPGEPKMHWWGMEKPGTVLPVTVMRCPRCGMLESYARPA